ncbi:MAG: ribonuclease T2 [Hyphomicrobiaceae bacterium]|nr:ribonuclease T2 [Hyphomicrobiaceae bacterium]
MTKNAARPFCLAALVAATLAALLLASPATAQRSRAPAEHKAGVFDYYALVLSWSPTYCASAESRSDDPQCRTGRGARPYAFVLHGLWPQYERGYPEYCRTAERPFVPQRTIDGMLDIMPSPRLVIHEYRKHGTCTGLDPEAYYALSRRLHDKVTIPQRFQLPAAPFFVSPQQVADEFMTANPGLKLEMLAVECRGSGNRLRQVRICFSREGEFRRCGGNEQRGLCRSRRMYVPPVRGGPGEAPATAPSRQRDL